MQAYDFPVELQPLRLPSGAIGPRTKALVRTDTDLPLSVVSDRYKLVPYKEIVEAAEGFVGLFGNPERSFYLDREGKRMSAEFTYRDRTETVGLDDVVGLRVWIENSYNKNTSVRFRVGGLRLKCLNGMASSQVLFEATVRHTAKSLAQGIQFPKQDEVLNGFRKSTDFWKRLGEIDLTGKEWKDRVDHALEQGVIPGQAYDHDDGEHGTSAWHLYNDFTHYVNHDSKASPLGKIRRLDRIDRFFVRSFP